MELPKGQTGTVGTSVTSTKQVKVSFYLDLYELDEWIKNMYMYIQVNIFSFYLLCSPFIFYSLLFFFNDMTLS